MARIKPAEKADDPVVLQRQFLAAYEINGNIHASCVIAGIDRKLHDRWKQEDTEYLIAFKEAQDNACDRLEAEARRRAVEGVARLRFYKGELIQLTDPVTGAKTPYVEHEYSDQLLMFLMRANSPTKYGNAGTVTGDPAVKTYVELKVSSLGTRSSAVSGDGGGEGPLGE